MSNAYRTYDVFTPGEEPFTGNPLALFLDATNFSESLMLKIAQEFNLSETCFIKHVDNLHQDEPSDGLAQNPRALQRRLSQPGFGTSVIPPPEYALHIFTTRGELPFAGMLSLLSTQTPLEWFSEILRKLCCTIGHPVIGAAHYLGDAGLLGKLKDGDVRRLLVAAGVVDLRYRLKKNGRVDTVELAAPAPPQFEEAGIPLSTIAAMVSLAEHDVIMTDALRPMFVSCGSPYLLIPVAGAEALSRVCPDNALRERAVSGVCMYSTRVVHHAGIGWLWRWCGSDRSASTCLNCRAADVPAHQHGVYLCQAVLLCPAGRWRHRGADVPRPRCRACRGPGDRGGGVVPGGVSDAARLRARGRA
jgi:predicted PhzF superfamily epimerase YddE/YHI9